jgi:hypothetical protein
MLDRREEILKTLRAIPVVLRTLVDRVDDAQLRRRPAPGEWAIIEVVGHLADTEERALARVHRMLGEDNPPLEPFDQKALAEQRRYLELDLQASWIAWKSFANSMWLSWRRSTVRVGAHRPPWRARCGVGRAVRDPRGCRGGRPLGPDRPAAVVAGRIAATLPSERLAGSVRCVGGPCRRSHRPERAARR